MNKKVMHQLIFICYIFIACSSSSVSETESSIVEAESVEDTISYNDPFDGLSSEKLQQRYKRILGEIGQKKEELVKQYLMDSTNEELAIDKAREFLIEQLCDSVFPAWYGTLWDYNGYTNEPREGVVACGYFVSTPMKHVGFNLNRYRLAQQYSRKGVELTCSNVKTYSSKESLHEFIKNHPDEIYMVGLDNHVGFITKRGEDVSFVHSNYGTPFGVVKEPLLESTTFGWSKHYVLGNLTGNRNIIVKWLLGEEIIIK